MGVSNVQDLKHVLGTVEDSSTSKSPQDDDPKSPNSKKPHSEDLFYRDSSTFLKVDYSVHKQFETFDDNGNAIIFVIGHAIIESA